MVDTTEFIISGVGACTPPEPDTTEFVISGVGACTPPPESDPTNNPDTEEQE